MAANTYYISWYTWLDQNIQTPWDFWFLSQGSRYKPKSTALKTDIDSDQVIAAFESGNRDFLDQLDINYINDVKLVAFVDADSPELACAEIQNIFGDAEFEKVQEVDAETKSAILGLIGQAVAKKAR
jgi:hypothetical protein